jgi:hypothetical protein
MDDYSQLKGSVTVGAVSERVWGVEKKRKLTDRKPQNGRKPVSAGKEKGEGQAQVLEACEEVIDKPDSEEEIAYGSHRMKKKSNRQIDMVV